MSPDYRRQLKSSWTTRTACQVQESGLPAQLSRQLTQQNGERGFSFLFPADILPDLVFLINRPLYNLCQMFPESASDAVKFVLRDAMYEMEGTVETTGRAAFPGLDVVSGACGHRPSHVAYPGHGGVGASGGVKFRSEPLGPSGDRIRPDLGRVLTVNSELPVVPATQGSCFAFSVNIRSHLRMNPWAGCSCRWPLDRS